MSKPEHTRPAEGKAYPATQVKPDLPRYEENILAYWKAEDIFKRSLVPKEAHSLEEACLDGHEFVFYDGPPFANGLPHYGHILTGFVKDVVPRFQTMKGNYVPRRFGWDCHGLPAEMEAEKRLGVSGPPEIRELGIDKFNDACRELIGTTTEAWREIVDRQARWVDMDDDYKTMDLSFMESVLWAFKQFYDKGLVYKKNRVVPYSWATQTPLSNFETRMDNATRPKQDPSFTVLFDLEEPVLGKPTKILVWTTTPWTLPSNLAIAMGPEVEYGVYDEDGVHYILATARHEHYEQQLRNATQVGTVTAADLHGKKYVPLFPFLKDTEGAFRVLTADFVTTEDGSGVVHVAPGFGEVDQELCEVEGIPTIAPVDDKGCFTKEISDYVGMHVFDANRPIAKRLRDEGRVVRHDTIVHNYPHCWRTDTPLIYRAVPAWYLKVTDIRDRMIAHNQQIHWVPEHVKDGAMGRWLEGARDWCISRNRFWGTPLPIWEWSETGEIEVFGSVAELEERFGVEVTDLHRPMIDELTLEDPEKGTLRRVPEVMDCWFESGSMPFAQLHYPFENKEHFERTFPASFICEYIAQTRGWFYTLIVVATAIFDDRPFLNCICHGVVLDEKGQKLSKRLKNYPDPQEVFDTLGADVMRWYLLGNPILKGGNMQIDKKGKGLREVSRMGIVPIWNCFHFFCLYANADDVVVYEKDWDAHPTDQLDKYIMTKLHRFVREMDEHATRYEIGECYARISEFTEDLSNWYIRRSRDRFWSPEANPGKLSAYRTLHRVLTLMSRCLAPFLPFLAEHMHMALTGRDSVHLEHWPDAAEIPTDVDIEARMDLARSVASLGRGLREEAGLRVRLPLSEVQVHAQDLSLLDGVEDLILEELNVKSLVRVDEADAIGEQILAVNLKEIGPKFGKKTGQLVKAANTGDWELLEDGRARVADETLDPEFFELKVTGKDGHPVAAGLGGKLLVAIDTEVTPELEQEGLARDLIRIVQDARKEADFHVSDRIELKLAVGAPLREAVEVHRERIAQETLTEDLALADDLDDGAVGFEVGGTPGKLTVRVVS
jgi:isoleucyl-tRNA synthetase